MSGDTEDCEVRKHVAILECEYDRLLTRVKEMETEHAIWEKHSLCRLVNELTEASARIEALESVLKTAREEIEQSIKDRFWSINKEYLAKEYVENSSVLKLIDRTLSSLDSGEKDK